SIINLGSVTTHYALLGSSVYTASKAAIDGYTTIVANELGPRGIRVNTLKPGLTLTEKALANGIPDSVFAQGFLSRTPLGRLGTTDEIAKAAVFLASDDAAFITGVHLLAAGGLR
ncbi:SDR family NAD(P)-dependent oxidoreductase, partial [Delftia sp. UME58]